MDRVQINVRIPEELADRLDAKRVELKKELGKIPSRSEVVRMAIDDFLTSTGKNKNRG